MQSILAIAPSSIGGQAFHVGVAAFPSQVEWTLDRYSGGYQFEGGASSGYCSDGGYCSNRSSGSRSGQWDKCVGCKMIHPWMKNSMVVCPKANKPGVCAATQAAYQEWPQTTKTTQENKKRNHSIEFDKLSNANKTKIKEVALVSKNIHIQSDASPGDGSAVARDPHKKPMVLVANVIVLSFSSGSHDILPAPIVLILLHIHL